MYQLKSVTFLFVAILEVNICHIFLKCRVNQNIVTLYGFKEKSDGEDHRGIAQICINPNLYPFHFPNNKKRKTSSIYLTKQYLQLYKGLNIYHTLLICLFYLLIDLSYVMIYFRR